MANQRWDPVVRITHWGVATGFILNRLQVTSPGGSWHEAVGISIAVLILLRLLWGLTLAKGPARLSALIPTPAAVFEHLREVRDRSAHRTLGHNPLGMVAIWLFWIGLLLIVVTGLGMGSAWGNGLSLYSWHLLLVEALTWLVVLHISAVVGLSLWLKRDLLRAMLPGRSGG